MEVSNPTSALKAVTCGYYTGNDSANRAIPHGLPSSPSFVYIVQKGSAKKFYIGSEDPDFLTYDIGSAGNYAVTAMDATNFYVGNAGSYANSANGTGVTYYWQAYLTS